MLTLLPIEERIGKSCEVCHTTKSVKYKVDVVNADGISVHFDHVCNKCALQLSAQNIQSTPKVTV